MELDIPVGLHTTQARHKETERKGERRRMEEKEKREIGKNRRREGWKEGRKEEKKLR